MEAYQVPTNDNFEFQDGGLRDHVNDTAIPTAWATGAYLEAGEALRDWGLNRRLARTTAVAALQATASARR